MPGGPVNDPGSLNRAILEGVARRVQPLLEEVVFVGGQVAELLITAPGATRVRPTTDVDIVVEASTRLRYAEVEAELRSFGLVNDVREGAPICRWTTPEGFTLDVMPTDENVLGFTNRWYPEAIAQARPFELEEGLVIRIPSAPAFLGTKWEAFTSRGGSDFLGSHDLEDVISVLAGRPEIVAEIENSTPELRNYLAGRAQELLDSGMASYAIQGALTDAARIPDLVARVLGRVEVLATMS